MRGKRGTRARAAGRERTAGQRGRRCIGPEKCVFIYNTNQNRFRDNWFEGCEIGIHFTAGSEGNEIAGNAFIGNRNQVKYVGTRYLDWSRSGRGNYWSDNPAFDLNGDGIADTRLPAERPHRPGALDRAAGQGADEQPGRAGDPLGAGAVPGAAAGRRRRQPSAHGAARAPEDRPGSTAMSAATDRDPGRRQALRQGRGRARRLASICQQGETVALVGHNGAGKTTLMKLMLGLIRPTRGSIEVLGDDPAAGEFAGTAQSSASCPRTSPSTPR